VRDPLAVEVTASACAWLRRFFCLSNRRVSRALIVGADTLA